jgi:tetratricopeptide (TPR) repeat protein
LAAGHQSGEAFNLLGWCFFREGNVKDAIASLDLAVDREPGKAAHYIDVGLMLFSEKRYSAALEAARRAVKAEPLSYRAHMLKGLAESRLNRLDDALTTYRKAKELQPAAEPWLAIAIVLSAGNREQEAEQTFQSAIQRFPKHALLAQEHGKFLLRVSAGEPGPEQTKAKHLLETALSIDPDLTDAHYELGKLALDENRPQDALAHLERVASLAPDAARSHFLLARAYRAAGREADAGRERRRFQELRARDESKADPSSPSDAADSSGNDAEHNLVLTLEP